MDVPNSEVLSDDDKHVIDYVQNKNDRDINHQELQDFISKLEFNIQTSHSPSKKKSKQVLQANVSKFDDDIQNDEITSTSNNQSKNKQRQVRRSKAKLERLPNVKNKFQKHSITISRFNDKNSLYDYKPRTTLLVKPGGHFFSNVLSDVDIGKPNEVLVKQLEDLAYKIVANELSIYTQAKERHRKSEHGWMKKVVTSGTLTDKVAALTLQVQESFVHNTNSLETLVNMAKKKGRRENSQAIECLQELFVEHILPDARPLLSLEQRPLDRLAELSSGNKDAFDRTLLLWHIESVIKAKYHDFIKAIETLTFDTVPASKKSAINCIFNLLSKKSEEEQLLLSILVNKVGDREVKIASRCAYLLTKLVSTASNPNMKAAVIKEVENLLYRPNISTRAQYYAVCFLSQITLSRTDTSVANKLISIYLTFFKVYIQKGEVDRKMMGSLLTGVNRAFPFSKVNQQQVTSLINDLYRLVHTINFNTSIQSLMLLFQLNTSLDECSDRFYIALYKKLADPGVKTSNKHSLMLNLLYKSMVTDTCPERIKAFLKRLLQVCCHQFPPFVCASLFLVSEVVQRNTKLSLQSAPTESSSQDGAAFAIQPDDDDDADDLEHFVDAPNPDSDSDDQRSNKPDTISLTPSSWHHQFVKHYENKEKVSASYNPLHRNPRFCNGQKEGVWELTSLSHHYHPSVALFATSVTKGEVITYDGDPLKDFTLIRFLDRFAFKNPKRTTSDSGSGATIRRRDYKPRGIRAIPVGSTKYVQTSSRVIPPDERFLYNYLKKIGPRNKQVEVDSDEDSISDDEFDAYLESINITKKREDSVDFAREMSAENKKSKKRDVEASSSEDEAGSDDEVDFDEKEIRTLMSEDSDSEMNEESIAFTDSDEELTGPVSVKKRKQQNREEFNVKKRKTDNMSDLFATADEFASLLEDNASLSVDAIGSSAMSNKDKASAKQIAWEAKQQKWINSDKRREKKRTRIKNISSIEKLGTKKGAKKKKTHKR